MSLKIIHTADWHFGKRLHKHDLAEDHRLFVAWFVECVQSERPDAVLISGDIFDLANPSNESRTLYYETLSKLIHSKTQVIITGGNHDSPSVLGAASGLLKAMNVHVMGGLPADLRECIVPIRDKDGKINAVVAAIPFLRDSDLRKTIATDDTERQQVIREGIKTYFQKAADHCTELYPGLPFIAMGHLLAAGASSSDSEREIQIGNLAHFDAGQFDPRFGYIALGHIHRPQKVGKDGRTRYSGSPVPLSFSERDDRKSVEVVTFDGNEWKAERRFVPVFRCLIRFSGTWSEVRTRLQQHTDKGETLPTLAEIDVQEQQHDPQLHLDVEAEIRQLQNGRFRVVKHRIGFADKLEGAHLLFDVSTTTIEDLSPADVLEKRMEREKINAEQMDRIREAFNEIVQEIRQSS
jgi:DNA repair protein SbcD/Mre11